MTGVPFHAWHIMTPEFKREVIRAEKIEQFLKQTSSEITLGGFLKMRRPKGQIKQNKSLRETREINMVELLLDSEYKDIAESMNSNQLDSLSSMFSKDSVKGSFPKGIVRNRALARAKSVRNFNLELNYVTRYLSPREKSSIPNDARIDELDHMLESTHVQGATPMVVFAAIAEVIVVRGFDKALEVASELKHLNKTQGSAMKIYEATVALIAEALEVTDDEMPFGWSAQLSEHSWVLTSHLQSKVPDADFLSLGF